MTRFWGVCFLVLVCCWPAQAQNIANGTTQTFDPYAFGFSVGVAYNDAIAFSPVAVGGYNGFGVVATLENITPGLSWETRLGVGGIESVAVLWVDLVYGLVARASAGAAYNYAQGWAVLGRLGLEYRLWFETRLSVGLEYGIVSYFKPNGNVGSFCFSLRYRL